MKRITLALGAVLLVLSLSGCGWVQKRMAFWEGYSKVCVDGVTYLQFPSGATPQVTLDGKYVACTQ